MHARRAPDLLGLFLICAAFGCGSSELGGNSTVGGAAGDSGTATGGAGASGGGASGTAGSGALAGAGGSGAAPNNGGTASGGAPGNGGAINAGGGGGTGSAPASGGAGSGGSVSQPYKGVANSACEDLGRLNVAWWYNWTLGPGDCDRDEFVPMISGKNEKTGAAVSGALTSLVNAGYRTVLGFNEPNKVDQSNLTVAQVVELWPALTANPDVRVGSPATSADAKAWFDEFMTEVDTRGLRVDFVAIHWYGWNAGSCNDARELENYVVWAESFNRPIWITEWGCMNQSNPNPEVVAAFYAAAIAMFDDHPLIERYAWYPWITHNELVASGGALTGLGTTFAAAPTSR